VLGKVKSIYFIGIGGIGMSGMAELLINLGYIISGSDLESSDRTNHLSNIGVDIKIGHFEKNIKDVDLVVYSSAVKTDNCEIVEAKRQNIPVIKRAEMLGELLKVKKYSIAVSGTHGKTTTTSMLGAILDEVGLNPTIVVGGIVKGIKSNSLLGDGDIIIVEADEYDKTLLSLNPSMSVVTNIDYEHIDIYPDLEDLKDTFVDFINSTPFYGMNVIYYDDDNIRSIVSRIKRPYLTYGKSSDCDIRYSNPKFDKNSSRFNLFVYGKDYGQFELSVPGEHNILNALGAIGLALELDISINDIKSNISKYSGVERRFEIKHKTKNNITIVDDYAHHPSEIDATILAAKSGWNINNLIIIFQPHLYSRTKNFYEEFSKSLSAADIVILTDIYPAREKKIEGVNSEMILDNLNTVDSFVYSKEDIPRKLIDIVDDNDMIIVMGAGDIKSITSDIYNQIEGCNV